MLLRASARKAAAMSAAGEGKAQGVAGSAAKEQWLTRQGTPTGLARRSRHGSSHQVLEAHGLLLGPGGCSGTQPAA